MDYISLLNFTYVFAIITCLGFLVKVFSAATLIYTNVKYNRDLGNTNKPYSSERPLKAREVLEITKNPLKF